MQIGNLIKDSALFPLAARTTVVGTYGSEVVDRVGFESAVHRLSSAASSAGTGVSLAVKLQSSGNVARGYDNSAGAADAGVELRKGSNDNYRLSIKFTQSGARQINKVFLKLKNTGTITAGKIVTVTIETDSTGNPSGTAVHADATANVLCNAIGSSYQWVEFAFVRPVDLADATVYHIVLTGDYTAHATNCIVLATSTVASGGNFNIYDSSWGTMSTTDKGVGYVEQYNFSDVTSQAFTAVTEAAGSFQSKKVDLRSSGRYLRHLATVTGTSASFQCSSSISLGGADFQPQS